MTDEMRQLTKKEAIAFAESGAWEKLSLNERAAFQLRQRRLAMPFDKFHEATEHLLGRPVWTHEFASSDRLIAESEGKAPAPSMADIIGLLPADKTIVVGMR